MDTPVIPISALQQHTLPDGTAISFNPVSGNLSVNEWGPVGPNGLRERISHYDPTDEEWEELRAEHPEWNLPPVQKAPEGKGTGNTVGVVRGQPPPAAVPADAANPPAAGESPKEQSRLQQAAQYYKDHISATVHQFAGEAMDIGGKIAAGGGLTMLAGGGVALTGVGAPVAAGMEIGGGAAVEVGGGVSAVGGAAETGATVFDKAADYVLSGQLPDLGEAAWGLAKNVVLNRLSRWLPGIKAEAGEAKAVANAAHSESKAVQSEAKAEEKAAEGEAKTKHGMKVEQPGKGGGDICKLLAAAIWAKANELRERISDLLADKLNLYRIARYAPHPSLPLGSGSWEGHIHQASGVQRGLKNKINEYDKAKCKEPRIPPTLRNLAYEPLPTRPARK